MADMEGAAKTPPNSSPARMNMAPSHVKPITGSVDEAISVWGGRGVEGRGGVKKEIYVCVDG